MKAEPETGTVTDDGGLQVHKDGSGDVLPRAGLKEKGVEGVVPSSDGFVARHLAVRLDAVFQAVKFPAGVPNLDTSLAHVDRDALTLEKDRKKSVKNQSKIL